MLGSRAGFNVLGLCVGFMCWFHVLAVCADFSGLVSSVRFMCWLHVLVYVMVLCAGLLFWCTMLV